MEGEIRAALSRSRSSLTDNTLSIWIGHPEIGSLLHRHFLAKQFDLKVRRRVAQARSHASLHGRFAFESRETRVRDLHLGRQLSGSLFGEAFAQQREQGLLRHGGANTTKAPLPTNAIRETSLQQGQDFVRVRRQGRADGFVCRASDRQPRRCLRPF
jgi:hypothetical protein